MYFKLLKKKQLIFILIFVSLLVTFYRIGHSNNPTEEGENDIIGEKWVVLDGAVPENIENISKLQDWKVVVVLNHKDSRERNIKNFVFLTLEQQKELNYNILPFVCKNPHSRKLIGYLYAISHGAQYVYEADEQHVWINGKLDMFDFSKHVSGLLSEKFDKEKENGLAMLSHIYKHFGRTGIWPKGYPKTTMRNQPLQLRLCAKIKTPIIQQGMIDNDDEIEVGQSTKFKFDKYAPPLILAEGIYSPFRGKNTLFHYDAFWTLISNDANSQKTSHLSSVYWAQRLIHLTKNYIGFYGPNVQRKQNCKPSSESYHDYEEQAPLETTSLKLIKMLQKWQCNSTDFNICLDQLTNLMEAKKFWSKDDVLFIRAWIQDLTDIGYKFPTVERNESTMDTFALCRSAAYVSSIKKRENFQTLQQRSIANFNKLCSSVMKTKFTKRIQGPSTTYLTKNVILVVVFNKPHFEHIPLLQNLYDLAFANVVFCSAFPEDFEKWSLSSPFFNSIWAKREKFTFVNVTNHELAGGFLLYVCLNKVSQMRFPNVDGYMVVADDLLYRYWHPIVLDKVNYPIHCSTLEVKNSNWYFTEFGERGFNELRSFLNTSDLPPDSIVLKLKNTFEEMNYCSSDIYYIPQKLIEDYQILTQLFHDHRIFLEFTIPKVLYMLGFASHLNLSQLRTFANDETIINGKYVWADDRLRPYDFFEANDTFIHAVKLSYLQYQDWRSHYCNSFLSTVVEHLNED